jgi:NhaA family Na+:H+ antiporter
MMMKGRTASRRRLPIPWSSVHGINHDGLPRSVPYTRMSPEPMSGPRPSERPTLDASTAGTLSTPPKPPLIERLIEPFRRFAGEEVSGGLALLAAAVAAVLWANSPWAESYHRIFETPLVVGGSDVILSISVRHFINDGLMAVFFFLVGLEIKREFLAGELSSRQTAALPILAALGGMAVPAALYALLTIGDSAAARGWGIPMATDIAFALGVLALLGDRIPPGLKVFLAALAIADDIGAVLVIAMFYSEGIDQSRLGIAALMLLAAVAASRSGVRRPGAYATIGLILWIAMMGSGVHATVAGVLLAMAIPVRIRLNERGFLRAANRALDVFALAAVETESDPRVSVLSNKRHHAAVEQIETLCEQAQPPLIRLEHGLRGVVAFGIMPLFALANAGISLSSADLAAGYANRAALAVAIGLLVGKPLGILGLSWIAVRSRIASLPHGVTWSMLAGVGMLGGIGFTMALFVGELAFGEGSLLDSAKLGIVTASLLSGVLGWLTLRSLASRGGETP